MGLFVPLDRFAESLFERHPGLEAELAFGPGRIQAAARLAVRLGRVPGDGPGKADQLGNQVDQVANRDLDLKEPNVALPIPPIL